MLGPTIARDPDDRAIDAGVQVAAPLVVGEEGGQLGQQAQRCPGLGAAAAHYSMT
jgi:hypothetical protein